MIHGAKRAGQALKKYFIPHQGNENKPHLLRARAIAFFCMVVLVAECAFVFGIRYGIPHSSLYGIVETNALIDETNQNRVANNIPALQVSPLLQAAAQEKANDMATKSYFAHTSPQGLTPWYWFQNVGYSFDYAGENLAVNFSDSRDVTNAWMNSPEHRANILNGDFTQIGIATAQGVYNGQMATYVVEEFGTPAPASAPVSFVNTASAQSVPTTAPVAPIVTKTPAKTITKATKTPAKTPVKNPVPSKNSTSTTTPTSIATSVISAIPVVSIVSIQSSTNTSSQETFVAVKGASLDMTQSAAPTVNPRNPDGGTAVALPVPQGNFIQRLFSNPKMITNDFYIFLMVLFAAALILNIFINIRVQYPRLIAGGLLVIIIAGLCVMLNQNIALFHAVVL